jgi:hypothetical protein
MRLIENSGKQFHKLASIQISLWFGVFTGVASVITAFAGTLNPWVLVCISIFVNIALIPLARLVRQDDDIKSAAKATRKRKRKTAEMVAAP